uniref:Uncharacterized protein n=1 Tax=Rhizophora mucronata TaxID=61149 RepID=A0A2P2NXX3_RHIMU
MIGACILYVYWLLSRLKSEYSCVCFP